MAVKFEIEIVIDENGIVTLETHGIKGAKCDDEVIPLARALGIIQSSQKTSEAYERTATVRDTQSQK